MHPSQSRGALALCLVVALALASTPALAQDTQELRDASPCVQRVRYWYGQGAYNVRLRLRRILNDIEDCGDVRHVDGISINGKCGRFNVHDNQAGSEYNRDTVAKKLLVPGREPVSCETQHVVLYDTYREADETPCQKPLYAFQVVTRGQGCPKPPADEA